jgi:hypothetical protein
MAEPLKQQHNLVVLQLSLDRSSSSPSSVGYAIFDLKVSDTTVFKTKADCAEMGLPKSLREAREYLYEEPAYSIPDIIVQGLQKKLSEVLDAGTPLWLQLTNDCGILVIVPWERLLQPLLRVPLFRQPYFALKPFSPSSSSLNIVLCASTPVEKLVIPVEDLLDRLIGRLLETVQREVVVIHVFADAVVYPGLQSVLQDRIASKNDRSVWLYDPTAAPTSTSAVSSTIMQETPGYLENPWLHWMLESLKGCSADVVHFLCHGDFSTDQGALAFAASPASNRDRKWAQFVGAQQLTSFLTHLGASTVGFSPPERDFSTAGLRLLADQLAHLRVGTILLHEVKRDVLFNTVAQAYSLIFDDMRDKVPSSPALAFYCHPGQVKQIAPQPGDVDQESLLNQYTLAKGETLQILESKETTPSWIASSQRYLEQSVADLVSTEPLASSSTLSPMQHGVGEALSFLSDSIMRHASSANDLKGKEDLP